MKLSITILTVLIVAVVIFSGCASSRRVKPPSKINRLLELLKKDHLKTRAYGRPCPENYFRCVSSGICIQSYFRCDGHDECGDNSDEVNCPKPQCKDDQIPCANNVRCMDPAWRCDGDNDCGDFSDEKDCDKKPRESIMHIPVVRNVIQKRVHCNSDQHTCDDGTECILKSWVCDGGSPDCDDGSDELNCRTRPCYPNRFKCADTGHCIRASSYCNYENDCADGSDEVDCPPMTCAPSYFKCLNVSKCIPENWICDGDSDCADESDEFECGSIPCPLHRPVRCVSNGACRYERERCDGFPQCSDGSDERNCQNQPTRVVPTEDESIPATTEASSHTGTDIDELSDDDEETSSDVGATGATEVGDNEVLINEILAALTHPGEDDITGNGEPPYGWEQRRSSESIKIKKMLRSRNMKSRKALEYALEKMTDRSV